MSYLAAFAVVLGINLLPAFGPPTWSVLILFRLRSDLHPVVLVVMGAAAAATGRSLLALGCRLVSYSLYVAGASAVKKTNLGNLLVSSLTSPWGIAVQVAFLAGVVALAHIDWAGLMVHRFRR